MGDSTELSRLIKQQSAFATHAALDALCKELLTRYKSTAQAILFYGSCLRSGNPLDGLVDLYVIVDDYRTAYGNPIMALLNKLLPPNVYYLELPFAGGILRAKYAILSLRDLQKGTSRRWFQAYLWGRFAQPAGLLYTRDSSVEQQIFDALGQAVLTFLTRVLPYLPTEFTNTELWQRGMALSYATELRAEKSNRADTVYAHFEKEFEARTLVAMSAIPYRVETDSVRSSQHYYAQIPRYRRISNRVAWTLRKVQGKPLSILRLIKAAFTFKGGVDYLIWKLERHSGTRIEAPARLRRHPLLFGWRWMWNLYRRRVVR
jgi:hypothetical protein